MLVSLIVDSEIVDLVSNIQAGFLILFCNFFQSKFLYSFHSVIIRTASALSIAFEIFFS